MSWARQSFDRHRPWEVSPRVSRARARRVGQRKRAIAVGSILGDAAATPSSNGAAAAAPPATPAPAGTRCRCAGRPERRVGARADVDAGGLEQPEPFVMRRANGARNARMLSAVRDGASRNGKCPIPAIVSNVHRGIRRLAASPSAAGAMSRSPQRRSVGCRRLESSAAQVHVLPNAAQTTEATEEHGPGPRGLRDGEAGQARTEVELGKAVPIDMEHVAVLLAHPLERRRLPHERVRESGDAAQDPEPPRGGREEPHRHAHQDQAPHPLGVGERRRQGEEAAHRAPPAPLLPKQRRSQHPPASRHSGASSGSCRDNHPEPVRALRRPRDRTGASNQGKRERAAEAAPLVDADESGRVRLGCKSERR